MGSWGCQNCFRFLRFNGEFSAKPAANLSIFRQGCSQSEFQVTNFFSCSEECVWGEVFGDKCYAFFLGKIDRKFATQNPPDFSLPNFPNLITLNFWDRSRARFCALRFETAAISLRLRFWGDAKFVRGVATVVVVWAQPGSSDIFTLDSSPNFAI